MFEIRRISPKNLARIVMTIAVFLHMLVGILLTVAAQLTQSLITEWAGVSIATWTILTIWFAGSIVVGIVTYLLGLFAGFLYNLTAQWWGGLRVTLLPVGLTMPQKQTISKPERIPAQQEIPSNPEPSVVIPKTIADAIPEEGSAPVVEKRPVRRSSKKSISTPVTEEQQ